MKGLERAQRLGGNKSRLAVCGKRIKVQRSRCAAFNRKQRERCKCAGVVAAQKGMITGGELDHQLAIRCSADLPVALQALLPTPLAWAPALLATLLAALLAALAAALLAALAAAARGAAATAGGPVPGDRLAVPALSGACLQRLHKEEKQRGELESARRWACSRDCIAPESSTRSQRDDGQVNHHGDSHPPRCSCPRRRGGSRHTCRPS